MSVCKPKHKIIMTFHTTQVTCVQKCTEHWALNIICREHAICHCNKDGPCHQCRQCLSEQLANSMTIRIQLPSIHAASQQSGKQIDTGHPHSEAESPVGCSLVMPIRAEPARPESLTVNKHTFCNNLNSILSSHCMSKSLDGAADEQNMLRETCISTPSTLSQNLLPVT